MRGAVRVGRLSLAIGALCICFLPLGSAHAQTELLPQDVHTPPPVENPIKKKVKEAVGQVVEITEKTVEAAEKIVEETPGKVEEAVKETVQTVEETAGQVKDKVDEVVDGVVGGNEPNTPNEPGKTNEPDRDEPDRDRPTDRDNDENESEVDGTRISRNVSIDPPPASAFSTRPAVSNEISSTPQEIEQAAGVQDAPATPSEVAERLAFPLLMTLAVLAYLLFQGRFDRSDPKLAMHTELDGERLGFE